MIKSEVDYQLEFLLAFDGRIHHLADGYWLKFEIKRVQPTGRRPHGLSYSFTLHAPDGSRLVGFDNAHMVSSSGSGATDHWHRAGADPGRPYPFKDVDTLIVDFFDAVERILKDRGIGTTVIRVEERRKPK